VTIEKRPKIVEKRRRLGDMEVDFMMGKNHKGAVLVVTDRATLHTRLHILKGRNSKVVSKRIIHTYRKANYPIHTFTFDNDQGFADHLKIAKEINVKTYFTRPYTSQDKGTVENRIGQLRRFFPKKTDLNLVTYAELRSVEYLLKDQLKNLNLKPLTQRYRKKLHLLLELTCCIRQKMLKTGLQKQMLSV
jgi:IS30 family transposase